MSKKLPVPTSASDGQIMVSAGRYARNAVLAVFDQIGGIPAMAEWAKNNQGEFYTKLFAKTITREVEGRRSERSVEDILDAIDAECEEIVDAEADDV